jgi:hypothetical protein
MGDWQHLDPFGGGQKSHRSGWLGDRSVAFWTVTAGIVAVLTLSITLWQMIRSSSDSRKRISSEAAPPVGTDSNEPSSSPSDTETAAPSRYVSVPFGFLCGNLDMGGCVPESGTVQIGSNLFSYSTTAAALPDSQPSMTFSATTCRTLSLQFGIDPRNQPPAKLVVTVSIIQAGSGPQRASVTPNHLAKLAASLNGSPWGIDVTPNMPVKGHAYIVAMDGSGGCATDDGETR